MDENLCKKIVPDKIALLVIDMQNDFCHPQGALPKLIKNGCSRVKSILPYLQNLLQEAKWLNIPVVFIRTTHDRWSDSPAWLARPRARGDICRTDSWGAEFYEVEPGPEDYIITKHRYSAFAGTNLDLILRSLEIKTIIVTGVSTNVCVESTVREGFSRDYHIIVPLDCSAAYSEEEQHAAMANMSKYFASVITSAELISAMETLSTG